VSFGARLRELREQRRLSQSRLAIAAEISGSYLSDLERDVRGCPTGPILARLAQALGVTVDTLLQTDNNQQGNDTVTRNFPAHSKAYEELSDDERKSVDELTRDFEEKLIEAIRRSRKQANQEG
jgi:transcriptional regulator with XRE-family HTH domain